MVHAFARFNVSAFSRITSFKNAQLVLAEGRWASPNLTKRGYLVKYPFHYNCLSIRFINDRGNSPLVGEKEAIAKMFFLNLLVWIVYVPALKTAKFILTTDDERSGSYYQPPTHNGSA